MAGMDPATYFFNRTQFTAYFNILSHFFKSIVLDIVKSSQDGAIDTFEYQLKEYISD
jgi:hypothetical protein